MVAESGSGLAVFRDSGDLPMRICTICDGIDAVMRLASWLAHFPSTIERVDLDLSEASAWLLAEHAETFDMLVIAPHAFPGEAATRTLSTLLLEMRARSAVRIILLPVGGRMSFRDLPDVHVLTGPPFPPPSHLARVREFPEQGGAESPWGVARKILSWMRVPPAANRLILQNSARPESPESTRPLRLIATQPLRGGAGGSTFSAGLALELAEADPQLVVCLLDLDLQFGTLAAAFALHAEPGVTEVYRNPRIVDGDMFRQSLQWPRGNLALLSAPPEVLPSDALSGSDLQYLLGLARDVADIVIVDLPLSVTDWHEAAWLAADRVYMIGRLDLKSAGALRRLRGLVEPRVLPEDKLFPLVNFRPRRLPRDWQARLSGFETAIGLRVRFQLPDGGADVGQAEDSGVPLLDADPSNDLRRAFQACAADIRALIPRRAVSERRSSDV